MAGRLLPSQLHASFFDTTAGAYVLALGFVDWNATGRFSWLVVVCGYDFIGIVFKPRCSGTSGISRSPCLAYLLRLRHLRVSSRRQQRGPVR